MRYGQRGGYTPAEQERRERVRLEAASMFAQGASAVSVAGAVRVTVPTARRWRREWSAGGIEALRSKGPVSIERLTPEQFTRLEAVLEAGPAAFGFGDDQRWTLKRIKTVIGRLFHVGYTEQGVWKLMRRHGWTPQVPVRRALERDEEVIAVWKEQVWPAVKPPPPTRAPSSASKTKPDKP
jgi:putative transposase